MYRVAVAVLVLTALAAGPASGAPDRPTVAAAYPNPAADGDRGEFVVLSVPPGTDLGAYALADDDAAVPLPEATASGRVRLSTAPNRTRELVDGEVLALPDGIALANSGERLRLHRGNRTVDAVRYADAPEGEVGRWTGDGRRPVWTPLGATDFPVVTAGSGNVTAFTLPDSPAAVADALRGADERILLAGYTFTSRRVAEILTGAARDGVDVRVLVDAEPVGGLTRRETHVLDGLSRAGANVTVLGGARARYEFHHAKYAVADGRAVVTTENWKPAGVGGNSSRGWGVVTGQERVVEGLARTFRADAGWADARPWSAYRDGRRFEPAESPPANGTYPSPFDPERLPVEGARLLVAPDNAEREVLDLLAGAEERIAVEQVSIGSPGQPFLREAVAAARRGVSVRILLSGAWYVREENRRLVERLNDRADAEGLPLTARVADPRGRFEKIHTKGVVVDGDRVLVGSLNWNNHSARQNREVALLVEGRAAGRYFQQVFEADWRTGTGSSAVRIGLIVAVGAAALLVLARARTIRFDA